MLLLALFGDFRSLARASASCLTLEGASFARCCAAVADLWRREAETSVPPSLEVARSVVTSPVTVRTSLQKAVRLPFVPPAEEPVFPEVPESPEPELTESAKFPKLAEL